MNNDKRQTQRDILIEIRDQMKTFNNRNFWLLIGLIGIVAGKEIILPL